MTREENKILQAWRVIYSGRLAGIARVLKESGSLLKGEWRILVDKILVVEQRVL